jgi:hypothetical protein
MLRRPVLKHALAQQLDHVCAIQASCHADRQTFSRELVDHSQQPQTAAIVRARIDEIVAPDVVRVFRAQPDAASIIEPKSSPRPLLGRNFQSLTTPDALHAIFADTPTGDLEQRSDASVAKAAVLAGQGDNRLREPIFVVSLRGLIALRAARLPHQPAGVPFTQSFFPSVMNGDPAPLGT